MKRFDDMTPDEQERHLERCEADYCLQCGGCGSVLKTEEFIEPRLTTAPYLLRVWRECQACRGTGRT